MNAIQLRKPDGTPVEVFYCSKCGAVSKDKETAESCCKPRTCERCEQPITEQGRLHHRACWLLTRFEKAEKLTDWDGWVQCDEIGHNDGFFESIEDLREYCEDEGIPAWAFTCKRIPFPAIDINWIVEHVNDNSFEDAAEQLKGLVELESALDAFNQANKELVSYTPNYKRVVLLDAEPKSAQATEGQ